MSDMPGTGRESGAARALAGIVRNQFTLVSQLFLHKLLLEKSAADDVIAPIQDLYNGEIRRAFRLIERFLELGGLPRRLWSEHGYAEHLPRIGKDAGQMVRHDLELLRGFAVPLQRALATCKKEGELIAAQIITDSVADREKCGRQLQSCLPPSAHAPTTVSTSAGEANSVPIDARGTECWSNVLGHLTALIEQTLLHAFVLRNKGYPGLADHDWRTSFNAMRDAAGVVERLRIARTTPDLVAHTDVRGLAGSRCGGSVREVLRFDRDLEERAASVVNSAVEVFQDGGDEDSVALGREILAARQSNLAWLEGQLDGIERSGMRAYRRMCAATDQRAPMAGDSNGFDAMLKRWAYASIGSG